MSESDGALLCVRCGRGDNINGWLLCPTCAEIAGLTNEEEEPMKKEVKGS
jgi:hypothetical protein